MRETGKLFGEKLRPLFAGLLVLSLFVAAGLLVFDLRDVPGHSADATALETVTTGKHPYLQTAPFELRPGVWEVHVDYTPDPELESVSMAVADLPTERLFACESDTVALRYYQDHQDYRIYVHTEATPVRIINRVPKRDALPEITSVRITYQPLLTAGYDLGRFLCAVLILLSLWLFVPYWVGLPRSRRMHFLCLCAITMLSLLPICTYELGRGHDFSFHLYRILGMAQGMADGQIPVRLQPLWGNGHGYPVSIMYGDLLLYPAALLYLIGFPMHAAVRFLLFYLTAATAVVSDLCFGRILRNPKLGLAGSAIYVLSVWRLTDVYVRWAVGEYAAMIFLPLIALGACRLIEEAPAPEKEADAQHLFSFSREEQITILCLTLGFGGLLQTHVVTLFLASIAMAVFCIRFWRRFFWTRRLYLLMVSAIWTVILNLWFLVPFVDYSLKQDLYVYHVENHMQTHGVDLYRLFSTHFSATEHALSGFSVQEMPQTVGLALLFGIMAAAAGVLCGLWKGYRRPIRDLTIAALVCLVLSLQIFPYDWINAHMHGLYLLYGSIEFPFRIFPLVMLFGTLLILMCTEELSARSRSMGFLFLSLLICISGFQAIRFQSEYRYEWDKDAIPLVDGRSVYDFGSFLEYTLIGTGNYFQVPEVVIPDGVDLGNIERQNLTFRLWLRNRTSETQFIQLPVCGYKGMQAIAGHTLLLSRASDDAELEVGLPPGFEGEVVVGFRPRIYWRAADLISLAAWLIWVLIALRRRHALRRIRQADTQDNPDEPDNTDNTNTANSSGVEGDESHVDR
ncbi:MAG: hypothetical protein IJT34_08970 [Butyrivibrio sp.]|nr:hypothetical protein [Butyrivibrio sp.]